MEYIAVIEKKIGEVTFTTTAVLNDKDELQYKSVFTYKAVHEEVNDSLLEMCGINTENYHIVMDELLDVATESLEWIEYQDSQGKGFVELLSEIRECTNTFEETVQSLGLPPSYFTLKLHKIIKQKGITQ